mmetsp:Transcript_26057/g.41009  ORF Transcript_26057/g.41009 Transcript_26057/m.41009 type:complete len:230 (-) Transcript_26057:21-710(-)
MEHSAKLDRVCFHSHVRHRLHHLCFHLQCSGDFCHQPSTAIKFNPGAHGRPPGGRLARAAHPGGRAGRGDRLRPRGLAGAVRRVAVLRAAAGGGTGARVPAAGAARAGPGRDAAGHARLRGARRRLPLPGGHGGLGVPGQRVHGAAAVGLLPLQLPAQRPDLAEARNETAPSWHECAGLVDSFSSGLFGWAQSGAEQAARARADAAGGPALEGGLPVRAHPAALPEYGG